jgi:hypothetical protein
VQKNADGKHAKKEIPRMSKFKLHKTTDPPYLEKRFTSRKAILQYAKDLSGKGVAAELYERNKDTGKWTLFSAGCYCRRCGRVLTNLDSVSDGLGPECLKKTTAREGR